MAKKSEVERVLSLVTNEELNKMFENAGYDNDIPSYLLGSFAITLLGNKDLTNVKTKEEFIDFFQLYCHINYPTLVKAIEYCNRKGIDDPGEDDLRRAFDELYSMSGIPYPNPHPYPKKENKVTDPQPLPDNNTLTTPTKSKAEIFREKIKQALGSGHRPVPPKGFEFLKQDRKIEGEPSSREDLG